MFLSRLTLNPRNRATRKDLSNLFELHRTISSGFPDGDKPAVLFRTEKQGFILVQSEDKPSWSHLYEKGYTISEPECKEYSPLFHKGQTLGFRLRANPTVKRDDKRLGLFQEESQRAWLIRKLDVAGADIDGLRIIPEGFLHGKKDKKMTFLSVVFEGFLTVNDPDAFSGVIEKGVGSAKGFGFGLLSVTPI